MQPVFLLKNQYEQYLTKSGDWIDGGDWRSLVRSEHRDELINEKVELTVKNPTLRIRILEASLSEDGLLINGESFPRKSSQIAEETEDAPAALTLGEEAPA